MRERDMNQGRKSEMLRSTGKNGQKRNVSGLFDGDKSWTTEVSKALGSWANDNLWEVAA